MKNRIDVNEINVKQNNFPNEIRSIIDRFEDQEFTAKHVINYILNYTELAEHKPPASVGYSVRHVLRQGIARGQIEVVREPNKNHTPGIYRRVK